MGYAFCATTFAMLDKRSRKLSDMIRRWHAGEVEYFDGASPDLLVASVSWYSSREAGQYAHLVMADGRMFALSPKLGQVVAA